MGIGIDLKPLFETMERMVSAFERLAAAIEHQNELTESVLSQTNDHAALKLVPRGKPKPAFGGR